MDRRLLDVSMRWDIARPGDLTVKREQKYITQKKKWQAIQTKSQQLVPKDS